MDGFLQSIPAAGAADMGADVGGNSDIVYAAVAAKYHVISGIMFSFGAGPPANTLLKVYDGDGTAEAQVIFSLDVTSDGIGFPIKFEPHKRGTLGNALVIRLMNAAALAGHVNCLGHYTQG